MVRRELAPSGVVDQHIEPAPTFAHEIDHGARLGVLRDIGAVSHGFAAFFDDVGGNRFSGLFRRTIVHDHLGALGSEAFADA